MTVKKDRGGNEEQLLQRQKKGSSEEMREECNTGSSGMLSSVVATFPRCEVNRPSLVPKPRRH